MRSMIVCCVLFAGAALFLPHSGVGVAVSGIETATLFGGSCYRDGNLSRTICTSSCGGTLSVQSRSTGQTGFTEKTEKCRTGYDCPYDAYSDTACAG